MKYSLDEHSVGVWPYDMYIPRHKHGYGMTWPMDKHRGKKHKKIYMGRPLVYCTHVMHILRHASFLWHTWGALMRWASNLVYIDKTLVQPQWHQQLQLLTFFFIIQVVTITIVSCWWCSIVCNSLWLLICLEQQIFQFGWRNFITFFCFWIMHVLLFGH